MYANGWMLHCWADFGLFDLGKNPGCVVVRSSLPTRLHSLFAACCRFLGRPTASSWNFHGKPHAHETTPVGSMFDSGSEFDSQVADMGLPLCSGNGLAAVVKPGTCGSSRRPVRLDVGLARTK